MANLISALSVSAGVLDSFGRALDVTQANVSNSSTTGYATQIVDFGSLSQDATSGLSSGLSVSIVSTRDYYAEAAIRREISSLGTAEQLKANLNDLQSNFDITGNTGISGSLNQLFTSFSALSVTPNDAASRQTVIRNAQSVAASFNQVATQLSNASANAENQIRSQVDQINTYAQQIQSYNKTRQQEGNADAGLDAKLTAALEKLSEIANISTSTAADGSTSVLLGGQIPLVLGSHQFPLHAAYATTASPVTNPGAAPAIEIQDAAGKDITTKITQGKLAGSLQLRNTILPSLRGDTSQTGSVNALASSFADRVNSLLTSGNISDGPPAVKGIPLFTYDSSNAINAAQSLSVNPNIDASKIAVSDPTPPGTSNGIALKLAAMAQGTNAADQINQLSFTAFYGQIAAGVGQQLSQAQDQNDVQTQAVAQAKSLRDQISGVSLDTEAVRLLQYQKSYQATSKLVTVLNDITQATLDMVR